MYADKKILLSKVTKGIAYGDVSNIATRNILTQISVVLNGKFTKQEMQDTLEYFEWRCPYTGKNLRKLISEGEYATDHIVPQNKEYCGLNIKGNLIIVDKKANAAKKSQDIETFLLHDTKVLSDLDELGRSRDDRLTKIRQFQKDCGYDPEKIKSIVNPILEERYKEVRREQEKCISSISAELKKENFAVHAIVTNRTALSTNKQGPELIFVPADENEFKKQLLETKQAYFELTYDSGIVKESKWKCDNFNMSSNLRGNIMSRPFWRNRKQEGLIKVIANIVTP